MSVAGTTTARRDAQTSSIKPRVLIVEDETALVELLRYNLEQSGFRVSVAYDGEEALASVHEDVPDLILLDWMLPLMSGIEVCRQLRRQTATANLPIIMLTARGEEGDRVRGLDAGADDYLTKPFSFEELLARLRALLRRGASARPAVLRVGDLTLDPAAHLVERGGVRVDLTAKEFGLLEFLMRHAGEVLSRSTMIDHVWDFAFEGDSNVVDVYVRYLREKIDRPFGRSSLETVRGAGYRLRAEGSDARTA
jgi:two-component system, OmpR family, phosphate regulon response regulator PhoB